ncbi:putative 3-phenylpropionic acid transporter [bacterium BMS3Bbin11]|nr:putative 3-phenylpropionic acid transporter [bacterium BMS3Abin11]GBE46150.1 putative 3-phenylpropionic acid transporter [bacterium BMS3Bbin11]GMT39958.1 MAG: MFS metabolite transporter [bacterium]HDH09284.1 MFS transporter [Gammaproteobacteria bacterium]HDH16448.1 MFS transporter [Gammaproteobacteria bacterium]
MPYWRLSSFYFVYFGTLGVLLPYWSPYLASLGFSLAEIGKLMAIIMVTKMIAPYIWAWLADQSRSSMRLVRLATLLSAIFYLGVFFGTGFWWLMVVMTLFTFFWNAVLPQVEVTTLNHLGDDNDRYGKVRLWGSIGFIFSSLVLGYALDSNPASLVLPVVMIFLTGIFISTVFIPDVGKPAHLEQAGIVRYILQYPELMSFLMVSFLLQVSHAPYYTFYTLYLSGYGYSKTVIGILWAVGVLFEVILFLNLHRILKHVRFRVLLIGSCLITGLRWLTIGLFPESLLLLVLAQVLHAISFGLFHGVAVSMVHRYFTGRHQHRGMALYGSISFGAGGAVGSLASGYMMGWIGASFTFAVASLVALIAAVLAWFSVKGKFEKPA